MMPLRPISGPLSTHPSVWGHDTAREQDVSLESGCSPYRLRNDNYTVLSGPRTNKSDDISIRSLRLWSVTFIIVLIGLTTVLALYALGIAHLANTSPTGGGARTAVYDIQGHRGGRGHTIENTLPSFAW